VNNSTLALRHSCIPAVNVNEENNVTLASQISVGRSYFVTLLPLFEGERERTRDYCRLLRITRNWGLLDEFYCNELYNHILLAVFLHIREYSVQPPASKVQVEQRSSLTPTSCTTTGMHSTRVID